MKKVKQILAIIGIILLVLLYLSTLICAIIDRTETMRLFQASVMATVIIPVLLWAYSFIYKLIKKNAKEQMDEMQNNSNTSLKDKANLSKKQRAQQNTFLIHKFGFVEINSDVAFLKVTPSEPYNYCFRKFGKLTSPAILDSFIKSGYFSLLSQSMERRSSCQIVLKNKYGLVCLLAKKQLDELISPKICAIVEVGADCLLASLFFILAIRQIK